MTSEAGSARASELAIHRRLLVEARPYWIHILLLFGVTMIAAPLALLAPLPLKIVVDNVVGGQPLPPFLAGLIPSWGADSPQSLLFFSAALLIGIALVRQLQELLIQLLRAYAGEKLLLRFRSNLFRHVQRLSLTYHDAKGTADATYRIQYDAPAIQHVAIDGIIPMVGASVTFAAMLLVTLQLSWQLAVVALAVSPALFFLTRRYRPRLRDQSHLVKKKESSALSVVQEVLTSLRVVKAFGQEHRESERFLEYSGQSLSARLRLVLAEGAFGLLLGITLAAGTAMTLALGGVLVLSQSLTLGELILVIGYVSQMYDPLKTMSKRVGSIQNAVASAERAFALLDEPPDVEERPDGRTIGRAAGDVRFSDVTFAYRPDLAPILQGVSFALHRGTRLGIAGATGAGKTTLVNLLCRFYDPTAGRIELDGQDLRDYRIADLRRQFAIVLQEPVLFSTSIAENIAYARPEAEFEEIVEAARAANVHDFVARLPDGYQTRVGERGMRLSGGERQRISLARAFLKDAPILILDEPTSSVDIKTEAGIMAAMERLMHGRTTIMIAHRLNTLAYCDTVIRLEQGRVVPAGAPEGHGSIARTRVEIFVGNEAHA